MKHRLIWPMLMKIVVLVVVLSMSFTVMPAIGAPNDGATLSRPRQHIDDGALIDVLVVYTNAARGSLTTEQIQAYIRDDVASANSALRNSDVTLRLALVYMAEVNYDETGKDSSTVLSDLTGSTATGGPLQAVHQLRNEYHADIIVLMAKGISGIANYLPFGASERAYAAIPAPSAFINNAFAQLDWNFEHEIGHALGSTHEWFISGNSGVTTYAHGYVECNTGKVQTLLAYSNECPGTDKIWAYSNPNLTVRGVNLGIPIGTDTTCTAGNPSTCDADSRQVFNEKAGTVAQYRSSQLTWTGNLDNDWYKGENWVINEGPPGNTTSANRVPRPIDDVVIPNGGAPIINSGSTEVRDLVIQAGGQLGMLAGNLNIYGNFIVEGTGLFQGNGGTVALKNRLDKPVSLQVNSNSFFQNLQIGDSTAMPWVQLDSPLDINGDVTFEAGAIFSAGNHTIRVGGNWTNNGGGFDYNTSTVIFDGSAQTIGKPATGVILNQVFTQTYRTLALPGGWVNITDVTNDACRGALWSVDPDDTQVTLQPGSCSGDILDAWFFAPAVKFSQGITYNLAFDYAMANGDFFQNPSDFSAYYGARLLPSKMTQQIIDIPNANNGTAQTANATFMVAAAGAYNLGFRNRDANFSPTLRPIFDNIHLTATPVLRFYNLTISSGSSVTLGDEATVISTFINNGTLSGSGVTTLQMKVYLPAIIR